jgi:hypothetical protein
MLARSSVRGLLLVCLSSLVVGCGNPSGLDSIQVTPPTQSMTVGQTAQFSVIGTFGNAKHPTTQNLTTGVTWTSSTPTVATVSATGLVTAVAAGTTSITAGATAFNGDVSSSANLTVTGSGGSAGATGGVLVSLSIIPSDITVGALKETGQFLAIGTFSAAPFVRDLTNSPTITWISDKPNYFPVNTNTAGSLGATAGIVTAYWNGTAVITAEAKNPNDGTLQTATATFNCPLVIPNPPSTPGSCYQPAPGPLLATLTVYNEGLNTTDWEVTANSATATPKVLDCGPASKTGSVCTATYPLKDPTGNATTVILMATGGAFGGWSYNCIPSDANGNPIPPNKPQFTAAGPNYCKIALMDTNVTVGAIFNNSENETQP